MPYALYDPATPCAHVKEWLNCFDLFLLQLGYCKFGGATNLTALHCMPKVLCELPRVSGMRGDSGGFPTIPFEAHLPLGQPGRGEPAVTSQSAAVQRYLVLQGATPQNP